MRRFLRARFFLLVGVILAGVAALVLGRPASPGNSGRAWDVSNPTPVTVAQQELAPPAPCEGRFVAWTLSAATAIRIREIRMYLSNGSGLAINDLDGDGRLDMVFASVDSKSAILWNKGDLHFEAETLEDNFLNFAQSNADRLLGQ
jgi:hypothetical protein